MARDKKDKDKPTRPKTGKPIYPSKQPTRTTTCGRCEVSYAIVHGHICKK